MKVGFLSQEASSSICMTYSSYSRTHLSSLPSSRGIVRIY